MLWEQEGEWHIRVSECWLLLVVCEDVVLFTD